MKPETLKWLLFFVVMVILVPMGLGGCEHWGAAKKTAETEADVKRKYNRAKLKMPRKPRSCKEQSNFQKVVGRCYTRVCQNLPGPHCKGKTADDIASAQWISCVNEELVVLGFKRDDCRLFLYDLEAAMKDQPVSKSTTPPPAPDVPADPFEND